MGVFGFALRYRHTFYVLALMMLFLGSSVISRRAWIMRLSSRVTG
jgi:hypothetical protein